jgi:ankyrin repeat protein
MRILIIYFLFSQVTALHHSSYNGHVDVCKFLVSAGADVNAKDSKCAPAPQMSFKRRRNFSFVLKVLIIFFFAVY